jgi:hypothetical protein
MATPLTRAGTQSVIDYANRVLQERDYSQPEDDLTLRAISTLINEATAKCFRNTDEVLQNCPKIQKGVRQLQKAPRLRGSENKAKSPLLEGLTPYEQMSVVKAWVDKTRFSPREKRTFALYHEEGPVPISVNPPPKSKMDLYPVFIGNSQGELKGPSYLEWQKEDPEGTVRERFIKPLDALEMQRTGKGDGALLLKKGAYESGRIDHGWRYAVHEPDGSFSPEASVELPKQKSRTAALARGYAPGYNLTEMIENRRIRRTNVVPERLYENFSEEDYRDDFTPQVTPLSILEALPSAAQGNTEELDSLIGILDATHLEVSNIPIVKKYTATQLGFS